FGFRNRPSEGDPSFAAILVGTSFSAGCSLNDEETLSTRLDERLGRPVYNAAGADVSDERELVRLVERLRMISGTVINEYDEASEAPHPDAVRPLGTVNGARDRL